MKRIRRRLARRCIRRAHKILRGAMFEMPYYPAGTIGRQRIETEIEAADLWFEIGKAIYPEWKQEAE